MIETFTLSEDKLETLCEHVLHLSKACPIILLRGDLASGKTTFVKALLSYLKIEELVTSPTFSTMNVYDDRIFHYDIYQGGVAGFVQKGLFDNFEASGIHLVEWADDEMIHILDDYGFSYISIDIEKYDTLRQYKVRTCTN